jgi:hypothetical protein
MSKFIVTKDNPHYPSVRYAENIADAIKQRDEWIKDNSDDDGEYNNLIVIAMIIETKPFKSNF